MIFGVAKAISREHDASGTYDVLIIDLSEVPVLGVTSSLALENAVQEAVEDNREVMIVGATGKVQRRLEKLGIGSLVPDDHWLSDRLQALETGLAIVQHQAATLPTPTPLKETVG
jgi:SulP family sulfate permease